MPPRWEAVRDAMPALFGLLENEPEPGVRAVLGHWLFGYVHPYPDGNGRLARFLMNAMLASGYVGTYVARYDSARSALAHKEYVAEGRHVRTVHQRHVHIHKPHGSLDWYLLDNQVMPISECLSLPRAIITLGLTKYRSGYSPCYEQQRNPATRVLDCPDEGLVK